MIYKKILTFFLILSRFPSFIKGEFSMMIRKSPNYLMLVFLSLSILSCKNSKETQQPSKTPEQSNSTPASPSTPAAKGTMVLFAGNLGGAGNINGNKALARFISPTGIAIDSDNNIYIADTNSNTIRKITFSTGIVSTLAGSSLIPGTSDSANGPDSRFNKPRGITVDSKGNIYVADTENSLIRKITPTGAVSTIANSFNKPEGIISDSIGNIYVSDTGNNTIRKITPDGTVTTIAGDDSSHSADSTDSTAGNPLLARFNTPKGITIDSTNKNLFIVDSGNSTIRQFALETGEVTTIAGDPNNVGSTDRDPSQPSPTVPLFFNPEGITIDSFGYLYVSDTNNQTIRRIKPDPLNPANLIVNTIAGLAENSGSTDGPSSSRFSSPTGIAVNSAGELYVTDTRNYTIRKINLENDVSTYAGAAPQTGLENSDTGSDGRFNTPLGLAVGTDHNLYVADTNNHSIRKVTPEGSVLTIAGFTGTTGNANGDGSISSFNFPRSIAIDSSRSLYVAELDSKSIRKIQQSALGKVTVSILPSVGTQVQGLAIGNLVNGSKNIYAALASLGNPKSGLAPASMIGMANSSAPGQLAATFGSKTGEVGSLDGSADSARFNMPQGVTIDSQGNVYVADTLNSTIRKISPAGEVSTIAGTALTVGATDGPATSALFKRPRGIAVDSLNNLYVADSGNHLIRKITFSADGSSAIVSTVAGTLGLIGDSVGSLPGSLISPVGLAVENTEKNVIIYATQNNGIVKITLP